MKKTGNAPQKKTSKNGLKKQGLPEPDSAESEHLAFSTIDALTAHIAVLDENGTIIAVNRAWREFAAANPPVGRNVCEGANYLVVCDLAVGEDQALAQAFSEGISAVMANRQKEFYMEYPCHSTFQQRWFVGRVTRFGGPGHMRIVVVHENITERKLAEEDLRHYREHLEEIVRERTVALEDANSQLVREIAERRSAEKAIRDSEERFHTLVDLSPDIIYRVKEDGIIDFISMAVRQLGYEPEELVGLPFEEMVHPLDRPKVRDILVEKRIGDRRIRNIEIRLIRSGHGDLNDTSSQCIVELAARGYWDVADSEITRPDKHFLYTLGIAHDVTARRQAAEALKENERRIGLLKDVATAANSAATVEEVFRVAIEGIARYLGWPVGHVWALDSRRTEALLSTDIWHFDDQGRYDLFKEITTQTVVTPGAGMIGRVLESRKPLWVEDMAVHPDFLRKKLADDIHVIGAFGFPVIIRGKVHAVLEFFSPQREQPNVSLLDLMEEIGIQLGLVIERKQVEETLKKLSRAIEQSPATVIITDVKGRIQYVNPKFSELTGFSSEEAVGQTPRLVYSGVHPRSFYQEMWKTILSGHEWYGQFCNKKKNGEVYWERTSISPVRNELGEITNFVAVKEDITELLQYEQELKQAKESAESANRAKSDFLASMSHELRTPLNAIIGFSEVIKDKYFGPLNDKQEEYVTDILDSGKHLLELINTILDLAKVEAGKTELELSAVNITDLIDSSLTMVREKAAKHGISLHVEIGPDVERIETMADEKKLMQVLFSLLSNAVKFTPDGGSIRLAAGRVSEVRPPVPGRDDTGPGGAMALDGTAGGFLEISIEDTGVGIAPEYLVKIFEPFFQVEGTQHDKPSGAGLGLPLSRNLVELHGGTIWAESRGLEKGSKFSFRIPIAIEAAQQATVGSL